MQESSFLCFNVLLTLAMPFGGCLDTPCFFENSEKGWYATPPFLCIADEQSFPQVTAKFCHQVILGQVTSSRQVTLPNKMFVMLQPLQLLNWQHESFR